MLKKLNLITIKKKNIVKKHYICSMNSHTTICYCDICLSLLRLTDGDYEHSFLLDEGPDLCARKKINTNIQDETAGNIISGYHKSGINKTNQTHVEYVKFTPAQRLFLQHMFNEYASVGKRDRNKHRIDFILSQLISMGYKNQHITRKAIIAWFKNERFRGRHRAGKKSKPQKSTKVAH